MKASMPWVFDTCGMENFLLKHVEFLYRRFELRTPTSGFGAALLKDMCVANWVFGLGLEEVYSAAEFDAAIAVLQIHGSH